MTGLHMAREMREQPGVLAALSARRSEIAECVRAVRPDPHHGTVLVARGSSDHAMAMLRERGAAVYEIADRLDAALPIPAELASRSPRSSPSSGPSRSRWRSRAVAASSPTRRAGCPT